MILDALTPAVALMNITGQGSAVLFLVQSVTSLILIVVILSKLRRTSSATRVAIRVSFILMFISVCLILGAPILPLMQQEVVPSEFHFITWLPGKTPVEFWLSFVCATTVLQVATLWDDTAVFQYAKRESADRRTLPDRRGTPGGG